jgi:hypothetical protein
MHEFTVIVDTTVLSVAHNRDFYIIFLSNGNRTPLITYNSVVQLSYILTFIHVFTNEIYMKVGDFLFTEV